MLAWAFMFQHFLVVYDNAIICKYVVYVKVILKSSKDLMFYRWYKLTFTDDYSLQFNKYLYNCYMYCFVQFLTIFIILDV